MGGTDGQDCKMCYKAMMESKFIQDIFYSCDTENKWCTCITVSQFLNNANGSVFLLNIDQECKMHCTLLVSGVILIFGQ